MNLVDTENDEALAEVYENDLASNGRQSESVKIDGAEKPGQLSLEQDPIDLQAGGWDAKVTGTFSTLKRYWPNGVYPKEFSSTLQCKVGGRIRNYQVVQVKGQLANGARLMIGLGKFTNRK